jgi:hypothetical protein
VTAVTRKVSYGFVLRKDAINVSLETQASRILSRGVKAVMTLLLLLLNIDSVLLTTIPGSDC